MSVGLIMILYRYIALFYNGCGVAMSVVLRFPVEDEEAAPARSPEQRSVFTRITTVLDAFQEDRALSLDDLTVRTGLPRSTVYRLAEQLRAVGWIERVPAGYRIGLRLFEIGGLATTSAQLRAQAGVWLFQAHQQSGQTVHLGVLDGDEVVYIDKVSPARGAVPTRIGGRYPAHRTALGRAMLSASGQDHWEEVLSPADLQATDRAGRSLRTLLAASHRSGIATDCEEAVPGLACVAAPIRSAAGVVGAISITSPVRSYRATLQRHAEVVHRAAESAASRASMAPRAGAPAPVGRHA
jgi:DNA-binding IclR family transcriptional regulator